MVATYQICTQKYPEEFLKLTYSQRTKLQEKVKELARDFPEIVVKKLAQIDIRENSFLVQLKQKIMYLLSAAEIDEQNTEEGENINDEQENFSCQPEDLIKLQVDLDDCLEQCLIDLSNSANKYLQEVEILPSKIPNQILALALQADENTSIISGAPNLLSILIEKDAESEKLDITPVIAICLRMNDLEFNDSNLNLIRQKIIKILSQLNKLEETYQNVQQEYAIAQAESAWRASWYED